MLILAVDTTSAFGSLALTEDDRVIEEMPLHSPEGFSQTLFDHIRRLLERHDLTAEQIDCFAAAAGPGSFTGVRIALTAVKGLAEASGARAIAVSNLEALAACGAGAVRAVVMDARRGEVYGAVYDGSHLRSPEVVEPFPAWLKSLPSDVTEVLSPDFAPFRANFPAGIAVIEQRTLAVAVARIARARLLGGEAGDPAVIDANYVRRSDAELNWSDR